jgi:hypothetical protein
MVFGSPHDLWSVVVKALLPYATAVARFRVGEGRTLAEMSAFDFVAAGAAGATVRRVSNCPRLSTQSERVDARLDDGQFFAPSMSFFDPRIGHLNSQTGNLAARVSPAAASASLRPCPPPRLIDVPAAHGRPHNRQHISSQAGLSVPIGSDGRTLAATEG